MKKLLFFSFFITSVTMVAQVGINTTTPAAQLEIKSSNQATPANTDGLLIPKIDVFPATNPTVTQQGMMVNLTTATVFAGNPKPAGFYYWDAVTSNWINLSGDKGWSLTGNAGTVPGANFIGTTDNKDLVFDTNAFERMRIKETSGNVGIGIATPSENLHVSNSMKLGDGVWSNSFNDRFLKFGDGNYITIGEEIGDDILSFKAKNFIFNPSGFTAGNLGIGTVSPTQKLDVQGGNARINNMILGDVGFGANWAGLSHQSSVSTTGYGLLQLNDGSYTLINKQNTGTGYIGFRIANVDKAVIANNGNMGIGTTAPLANLHVSNSQTTDTDVTVLIARNNATAGSTWSMGSIEYYTEGLGNIGFSSTVSPLGGNSTADLGSSSNTKYGGYRWGTLYCSFNPNVSSDITLKKEIKPLNYGLDQVRKINPISYIFKTEKLPNGKEIVDTDKTRMLGFSAQELQNILPEVVSSWTWETKDEKTYTKRNTETLGVRYGDIIPVAINAIKELDANFQQNNVELLGKIKILEQQNEILEKRLNALEAKLSR